MTKKNIEKQINWFNKISRSFPKSEERKTKGVVAFYRKKFGKLILNTPYPLSFGKDAKTLAVAEINDGNFKIEAKFIGIRHRLFCIELRSKGSYLIPQNDFLVSIKLCENYKS